MKPVELTMPVHLDICATQKLGIFSKIKEGENESHSNTLRISRIII
jgi:hypothetical protein